MKLPYERGVVKSFFRADGCHCISSFYNAYAVIARRIFKYTKMYSRAVLHMEGMYFSDCEMEQTQDKRQYLLIRNLNL
jgi:hypothetical protein